MSVCMDYQIARTSQLVMFYQMNDYNMCICITEIEF